MNKVERLLTESAWIRPKPCSYQIDDASQVQKAKRAKKCIIKQRLQKSLQKWNYIKILTKI